MPKYQVNHDYRSSRAVLEAGATVDLPDEEAEWLEHDSPGVLTALDDSDGADGYPEGGNAAQVLAWVNNDAERAAHALEREDEGQKRKGLTADLDAVVAAAVALAEELERQGVEVPDGGHGEVGDDGHARAFDADGKLVASTDPDDQAALQA